MLPTVVANELRDAICHFLRSAFPIATPYFQKGEKGADPQALIDDLLERPGELFKGPYLDIKLPFRIAKDAELPFRHLKVDYAPYHHQMVAFQRLAGKAPQSTIVATGTGSGKTECFMLPVLDDCLARREQGIKTIVVYPMNALATDQARRFAKEVHKLDTKLTVGLYVGGQPKDSPQTMGPDNIITCQKTLQQNPPDILLTNYKMLDFLLIRPKDQPLWRFNKPGMLRYLVVDELHTFDGAQGTDLACLVRRLRDRLEAGPELACVGTSATIGSDSQEELVRYASDIFATEFTEQSIVGENRLTPDEYLLGQEPQERAARREAIEHFLWPEPTDPRLDPKNYATAEDYVFHQARLWFADMATADLPRLDAADPKTKAAAAVKLGELLHRHQVFHELVRAAGRLVDLNTLAADWQQHMGADQAEAKLVLSSMISLIATARLWNNKDGNDPAAWCRPFLEVRQQLWLRELRRLVCSVATGDERPVIRFADDLQDTTNPLHMPLLHCRECHLAAWGGVMMKGDSHLVPDLSTFYQTWFGYSPQARLLVPRLEGEKGEGPVQRFCSKCFQLTTSSGRECPGCSADHLVPVWVPDIIKKSSRAEQERLLCHHDCPECGARESMAIMGYRAATLTSVMTGRLFGTPYNDDHKLIAFSDSVQDAAHRAGFLGANTWRQVVRHGMAKWLHKQPLAMSLREMADLMPTRWRDDMPSDEHFCGVFIAPNMEWRSDYRKLVDEGKLPKKTDLPELVGKRLAWECLAEFGRRSGIGRSLERVGVAAAGYNGRQLLADIKKYAEQCREEIEGLRNVTDEEFGEFVVGWLHHVRKVGALYDPVLDSYLSYKGKEYQLNRLPWMPGFGRTQRPPAAISLKHASNTFESVIQSSRETWSSRWLKKTLAREAVFAAAETRQIFHILVNHLTRAGWMVERDATGEPVWLLNPNRILIDKNVGALSCDHCRHSVRVAQASVDLYDGMRCLRGACHGQLRQTAVKEVARDYGITDPRRLVPHEHTGLLPREEREAVEQSFIFGSEPWDINLLSATPTLEMGIDIGSLSSVFLCSVPPAQANYLQRIGRAGRRDGNALAVTVANGQNHDLFFYEEPMEMMAGTVHTPGVFLNAMAVLERQLTAYCFDRWAASGIDESAIPGQLRKVLDAVEYGHQEQFPYNLLAFIAGHRAPLVAGFFGMFSHLDDDARGYLEAFIGDSGDGTLEHRLISRLQDLVKERADFLKKVQQLKLDIEKLKKQPQDESQDELIDDMGREKDALIGLLHSRSTVLVLNFFTDEGLLPNYAFPEEGVTLHSVILRRKGKEMQSDDESKYEKNSYVFQRPAQAALSELAPENSFYAVSHQMQIDQVDLNVSTCQLWRFCDRCQYTERVDIDDKHSACPRCGSAQWADSGQKHQVLKLRQVYSTVDDRFNRITDEAEQREPKFYTRQMFVNIPPESSQGGFKLKSDTLPFGFEFLGRASFREVNFGPSGGDTHTFSVAGREMARAGFKICRNCGKVQKERFRRHEQPHAFTCKLFKNPEQATAEDYLESLYLYREIESEAIRILLPMSEVAYSDIKLHSFIAALNLGLRLYFHGDVHHLEVTDMQEPAGQGSGERIYLLIFDRIPGGTGYLKDLMRTPDNMLKVLELARSHLTQCDCIDQDHRDGCYRCILAYRDSRNMPVISRRVAAELLGEILELRDQLEAVEGLGDVSTNVLIESKLEQKFVDALAGLAGAKMTKTLINGKTGSQLTLPGAEGRPVSWLVEHQVKLGPSDGVAIQTAVDVVLKPARAEDAARYRPIAVYLDGLQYHHDIVADDVCKRTSLLLSGQYWVYSLNWDDLPSPGKPIVPQIIDLFKLDGLNQTQMASLYDKMASPEWDKSQTHSSLHGRGSFRWLEALLRDPSLAETSLPQRALFRTFTALTPSLAKDTAVRQKLVYELAENAPAPVRDGFNFDNSGQVPGGFCDALGNTPGMAELSVAAPLEALNTGNPNNLLGTAAANLCFDDRVELNQQFKDAWRAFWHSANQLQFLPRFSMATRKAVENGQLDELLESWSSLSALYSEQKTAEVESGTKWAEVFDLSLIEPSVLRELIAMDIPEPEVGIDLSTPEGEVIVGGELVELCWREQKIALVNEPVGVDLPGWTLLLTDGDVVNQVHKLMEQEVLNV